MSSNNPIPINIWPHNPTSKFENHCMGLSKNLDGFKRDSYFSTIIGNDLRSFEIAKDFYYYIKSKYSFLLDESIIPKFILGDGIGNPNLYSFDGITISPGTLRYMKVLGDIVTNFNNISSVIELGSGYGGQCKIFKDYLNVDYYCLDIPGVLQLCKSYLSQLNVDAKFLDSSNVENGLGADLFISDYCISEFTVEGMVAYIEHIVKNCKFFYITSNAASSSYISNEDIIGALSVYFDVSSFPENPKTSYHPNMVLMGSKHEK